MDIRMPIMDGIEATARRNVLMKLGLRDRVQAVVLAYENAIVTAGT